MNLTKALDYLKIYDKCMFEYIQANKFLITNDVIIGYAEHLKEENKNVL